MRVLSATVLASTVLAVCPPQRRAGGSGIGGTLVQSTTCSGVGGGRGEVALHYTPVGVQQTGGMNGVCPPQNTHNLKGWIVTITIGPAWDLAHAHTHTHISYSPS